MLGLARSCKGMMDVGVPPACAHGQRTGRVIRCSALGSSGVAPAPGSARSSQPPRAGHTSASPSAACRCCPSRVMRLDHVHLLSIHSGFGAFFTAFCLNRSVMSTAGRTKLPNAEVAVITPMCARILFSIMFTVE